MIKEIVNYTMAKKTTPNRLKEYHEYLRDNNSKAFHDATDIICETLGVHETTWYRKIKTPQKLSIAEKRSIAEVYALPIHFIFPELEPTI